MENIIKERITFPQTPLDDINDVWDKNKGQVLSQNESASVQISNDKQQISNDKQKKNGAEV